MRDCWLHSVDILDRHCLLKVASDATGGQGIYFFFGIPSPCKTFDKGQKLLLVNENAHVLEEWTTGFWSR